MRTIRSDLCKTEVNMEYGKYCIFGIRQGTVAFPENPNAPSNPEFFFEISGFGDKFPITSKASDVRRQGGRTEAYRAIRRKPALAKAVGRSERGQRSPSDRSQRGDDVLMVDHGKTDLADTLSAVSDNRRS
jgi:hypothetical protein